MDNYFKIDDLDIEYPIHLAINGRKCNFKSEYEKKVKTLGFDVSHKMLNLLVDTGFFNDSKVYKNIPFLVTDDIRVKGDKRTYYIADYYIPEKNTVILLFNNTEISLKTPKYKYLKDTLYSLGYNVIVLEELSEMNNLPSYLLSLRNNMEFLTIDKVIYPTYFR